MRKILAFVIITCIMLQLAPPVYGEETEGSMKSATSGLFSLSTEGNKNIFVNHVDGYSLWVDGGMTVDMSYSNVCAVLENREKRIEIFKQPLQEAGQDGYINYSNKFAENTADHRVEYKGYQYINGKRVHITSWNRDKLNRVENDKNYYLVLDIIEGGYAYTIFVKANQSIGNLGGYLYLVQDFKTFAPTQTGVTVKSMAIDLEARNWNEETENFYVRYFSEEAQLTWGIFEPTTAMFDYKTLDYFESYINYEFPIILNYSEFENTYKHPNLMERLNMAYENGKILELTLQTNWKAPGTGNMVYDVLDGEYDAFLMDYATTIKEFGHPVIFRLGNEMNGDWCPYAGFNTSRDAMVFKEFYRYVHQFFQKAGADNVIWAWNPNAESFPNFKWNDTLMYYPGDEYVDVVGLTAYNTGTYYETTGEKWQEFNELYAGLYQDYVTNFGQPLMICEFASADTGGDKARWVTDMFRSLKNYPKIKVAIWWDGADKDAFGNIARSYYIDQPFSVLEVFKNYLRDSWKLDSLA